MHPRRPLITDRRLRFALAGCGRIYMVTVTVFWSRPQSYYDSAAWRVA